MMVYSYIFYYIHILMFFVGILYILQSGDTCKLFYFKFIFFKTIRSKMCYQNLIHSKPLYIKNNCEDITKYFFTNRS